MSIHSVNMYVFRQSKTDTKYYRVFLLNIMLNEDVEQNLRTESSYLGLDIQEKSEI